MPQLYARDIEKVQIGSAPVARNRHPVNANDWDVF
jgi:hypothetical protein